MSGEGGGWITWVHSKEGGDTGVPITGLSGVASKIRGYKSI